MALASWEPDLDGAPCGAGRGRLRCLVDLDAPCNMECTQCPRKSRGNRLAPADALALAEGLAEEIIASGMRAAFAVFYGGEPLLARDQLLAQARVLRGMLLRAGVECQLGLLTNGTRLDVGTAIRLARDGFTRVCVTMGGTRERHEARRRIPGGPPTYEPILEKLDVARSYLEVTVRYELHDDTDLTRLPEFVADLEAMGLLRGERPVRVTAQPPDSYAGQARALFAPRLRRAGGGKERGDRKPV